MFYAALCGRVTDVTDVSNTYYVVIVDRKINILSYKLTSVSNNFLQLSPTPHVAPGGFTEGTASFSGWNLLSHIVASCDYTTGGRVTSHGNNSNISCI